MAVADEFEGNLFISICHFEIDLLEVHSNGHGAHIKVFVGIESAHVFSILLFLFDPILLLFPGLLESRLVLRDE